MILSRRRVLRIGLILIAVLPGWQASAALAQEPLLTEIHVSKKQDASSGTAVGTVNGKARKIARHAVEAWIARAGRAALILGHPKEIAGRRSCGLRYYDVDAGKGRDLGRVPFCKARFSETRLSDGSPVFVLSGIDRYSRKGLVVAADTDAIHGRLTGIGSPKLEGESIIYHDMRSGQTKTVPLRALLGRDMGKIYIVSPGAPGNPEYVEFLSDGKFVLLDRDNHVQNGTWRTDGHIMHATMANGSQRQWAQGSLPAVTGVPAGTQLEVRLLEPLSSLADRHGLPVKAVLISPAIVDGKILVPQGSEFTGTIIHVHGVGWGIRHETASLTLDFTAATLPDGRTLFIRSRLWRVENSRERVDDAGNVNGIRATGTYGYSAEDKIASLAAVDPIAYLFTQSASTAMLGFAEPEILYPEGTELDLALTAPLITSKAYPPRVPTFSNSAKAKARLSKLITTLPFRTRTEKSNKASDLTNLIFIGSKQGLRRAFRAAGWVSAHQLTAGSAFQTAKSISGTHVYHEAPMSILLLDGRPPIFALSKSTNTFAARHHIRIFDTYRTFEGASVLTASSTHDIGIAVSRQQKTVIHVIDPYIDNERSKIVNDLVFTGCVTGVSLIPRPWVPRDAYNATGDRLLTDGSIAVLRIDDCSHPKTTPDAAPQRPPATKRAGRDTILALRNDLWRGNLLYQGVTGAIKLRRLLTQESDLGPGWGVWRKSDAAEYLIAGPDSFEPQSSFRQIHGESSPVTFPLTESASSGQRWEAPRYEIELSGGYLGFPAKNLEFIGLFLDSSKPDLPNYTLGMFDNVGGGWSLGGSATLNTWRWVSNQFGYFYQRGQYRLGGFAIKGENEPIGNARGSAGLATRQFEYNVLVSPLTRGSRWRPYAAIGPVLQLISVSGAPLKKPDGPFRLGLRDVGLLKAAFDFGSTPPLDGGGIYQLGIQYGGGIEFRLHPHVSLHFDFRETWSATPEIIRDSYTGWLPTNLGPSYDTTAVRERPGTNFFQQRFTLGLAYTF